MCVYCPSEVLFSEYLTLMQGLRDDVKKNACGVWMKEEGKMNETGRRGIFSSYCTILVGVLSKVPKLEVEME
jgi:hypothetical protein